MIRHVFKLIWNRKRANALIMLELFVTFLILFALSGFGLNLYRLYDRPLGFDVANTWSVTVVREGAWTDAERATYRQLLTVAEQMDEVVDLELIFDIYVTKAGEEARGVGLGLPLSRRLARLLGGELRAVSRPGAGGRFLLEVPLAEAKVPGDS